MFIVMFGHIFVSVQPSITAHTRLASTLALCESTGRFNIYIYKGLHGNPTLTMCMRKLRTVRARGEGRLGVKTDDKPRSPSTSPLRSVAVML